MQCQSYFPVYHSHYDLNANSNGGVKPLYNNGNETFQSGHYNNYVSSSPAPQGHFSYGKEFLRQTILMHEATFRDQVQELHRLYRRQKELMGEVKSKELYMNHLHLLDSHCWPSTKCTDNIQTSLNSIKEWKLPANPIVSTNVGILKDLNFPESKGKKIGGKLLDLELPAEVYIDTEERELLEGARFSEAPTSTSSSNKLPRKVAVEIDPIADLGESDKILQNGVTKSILETSDRSPDTLKWADARSDAASDTLKSLTQLQQQQQHTQFNEANSVSPTSSQRKPSSNLENNPSVVQALPCSTIQSSSSKSGKICINKRTVDDKLDASSRCSPTSDSLKHVNRLNYIDLNSSIVSNSDTSSSKAFIEVNKEGKDAMLSESGLSQVSLLHESVNSVNGESTRKSKKCRLIDINLPCDPSTEEDPLIEEMSRSSSFERISLEIDLEAPPSPEVEEHPPPRGDSEEGSDPLEELAKIAADVIVSISSSSTTKTQSFPETCASDISTLEWFAGMIHSMTVDLDHDLGTPKTHLGTCRIDDFEAMTLNLTEMKEEEYGCENNVTVTSSVSIPAQTRKGRTRRSKRKDFQREVLPSLASLSRYEVTEDIQMIEGLMEAAGTPWHLSRTRRTCRMGRRPRAMKQHTSTLDVPDLKDVGVLLSWGKVNRRPRGRRSCGTPSRWLEHVI